MASLFGNASVFEDQNSIRHLDSREAMGNQERHLAFGKFGESLEDFMLGARIQRGRRLVQNQQLRIAQIGARQRDFLPFATGQIDSAFEPATQTLFIALGKLRITSSARLLSGGGADPKLIVTFLDSAHRNIFGGSQFISHEILKNDADFFPQVFHVVLANIHAIQQDLTRRHIIQARKKFDDSRLSLAIFAHQRDPLGRFEAKLMFFNTSFELPG